MPRFFGLAILAVISSAIVFWAAGKLSLEIEIPSFLVGLGAAALAEFFRFTIKNWWDTMTEPYKPQIVRLSTKETPSQISSAASGAAFWGGLILAGLVLMPILFLSLYQDNLFLLLIPVILFVAAMLFLPIVAKSSVNPK